MKINRSFVASELQAAVRLLMGEEIPPTPEEQPIPPAELPDAEDKDETAERAGIAKGMLKIMKTIE